MICLPPDESGLAFLFRYGTMLLDGGRVIDASKSLKYVVERGNLLADGASNHTDVRIPNRGSCSNECGQMLVVDNSDHQLEYASDHRR